MNKHERNLAFVRSLHGGSDQPEVTEPDAPVDFDGGARETPPVLSNPVTDHDQFIAELIAATLPPKGNGGWRP